MPLLLDALLVDDALLVEELLLEDDAVDEEPLEAVVLDPVVLDAASPALEVPTAAPPVPLGLDPPPLLLLLAWPEEHAMRALVRAAENSLAVTASGR